MSGCAAAVRQATSPIAMAATGGSDFAAEGHRSGNWSTIVVTPPPVPLLLTVRTHIRPLLAYHVQASTVGIWRSIAAMVAGDFWDEQ